MKDDKVVVSYSEEQFSIYNELPKYNDRCKKVQDKKERSCILEN